jgi:biotin operon repressor
MKTGRKSHTRDAVQSAIQRAGTDGITGEQLAEQLGLDIRRVHASVTNLRSLGIMPVASRRFAGETSRYWASADLMPADGGTLTQRIIQWLIANPEGGPAEVVAHGIGTKASMVSSLLSGIAAKGQAVSRPAPQGKAVKRRHYYAAQHAALMPEQQPATEKTVRLLNLAPAAFSTCEADYSRAKVTICPSGTDTRFTFTPPHSGWRGAITRDWQDRRLQEQQHGR